jgi:oxygen-dependent protoporphyrinogen oxidase
MGSVIVIGAGISGLTAAYLLHSSGHEVAVFDQDDMPGGRMRSERFGGFLMECGANSLAGPATAGENLIAALDLGGEKVMRSSAARSRYLVRDGRARALPVGACRFILSSFFTFAGRLRLLMEPFAAVRRDDETVAAFTRRRLGQEMLDYVVDPLVAGLHAGDPQQLSVSAVFPQLKRLEYRYGSIILGAIGSRLRRGGEPAAYSPGKRMLFSFRQGLGMLPRAIAKQLGGRVFLGHRVESLRRGAGGCFRVLVRRGAATRWITADSVVVALPAYAAASVLGGLDGPTAETLAGISHPPLAVVFLGYRASTIAHPLDGLGMLMPAVEKRDVLGILFSSTLFAGRAPPGHAALTAFVGGARQPQLALLEAGELQELAHGEVRRLLGAHAAPVLARTRLWRRGLPQPGLDHARRIAEVAALEGEHPGLFFTGNYFSGVSTVACIQQASATAGRVLGYLASSRSCWRRERPPKRAICRKAVAS